MKNIILDATTLTSIMACGRMTDMRFHRRFQLIGGKSNSLEVGSIIHKGLEVYYFNKISGMGHSRAVQFGLAAADLYIRGCTCSSGNTSCGHEPYEYPGVTNTPVICTREPKRIGQEWTKQTLLDYLEHSAGDAWEPLDVEHVHKKLIYQDEDIRILWKAKIDLRVTTNGGIRPVDHKTMQQNRKMLALNNQFMGLCLVCDTNSVIINKIGLQKTLKPNQKFTRTTLSYTLEQLQEFQEVTIPYWSKQYLNWAESEYYPPNHTACEGKYGPCIFNQVCSGNPDDRERLLKESFMVGPVWDPTNSSASDNSESDIEPMNKHIHKYQRMKQGQRGHKIFKCVDCKHYLPHINTAMGRTARCWRCNHAFTIGKYQLTLAKPHCNDCIKTKHSDDVNKLAQLFADD